MIYRSQNFFKIFSFSLLGSQTYSRISELISTIIQEYQLEGKVQHIVTDNGLNFVKAIKDYFNNKASEASVVVTETFEEQELSELLEDSDEMLGGFVELEFESQSGDLFDIFESRILDNALTYHVWLPAHIRCASHTLNLLARADVETVLKSCSKAFQSKFDHSMKKIQDLWNKCGRSTKAAEFCTQIIGITFPVISITYCCTYITITGRQLPTPCATRWNSFFDSLRVLLSVDPIKLRKLCEKLQVPPIEQDEHNLLREYLSLMAPIAIYLDVLQGEKNCFLGLVLPTIMMLKSKLSELVLEICASLRDGILVKLEERYTFHNLQIFPLTYISIFVDLDIVLIPTTMF